MNFKIKFVALLIISVFLLSSCEVYQTLYGTAPAQKPAVESEPGKVARVEGEKAKDPIVLAKTAYGTAAPAAHRIVAMGAIIAAACRHR